MPSKPSLEDARAHARQYQLAMHGVPNGVIVSVGWHWPDVESPPICRTAAILDIPPPTTARHITTVAATLTQSLQVAISALAESFNLPPETFSHALQAALQQKNASIAEITEEREALPLATKRQQQ